MPPILRSSPSSTAFQHRISGQSRFESQPHASGLAATLDQAVKAAILLSSCFGTRVRSARRTTSTDNLDFPQATTDDDSTNLRGCTVPENPSLRHQSRARKTSGSPFECIWLPQPCLAAQSISFPRAWKTALPLTPHSHAGYPEDLFHTWRFHGRRLRCDSLIQSLVGSRRHRFSTGEHCPRPSARPITRDLKLTTSHVTFRYSKLSPVLLSHLDGNSKCFNQLPAKAGAVPVLVDPSEEDMVPFALYFLTLPHMSRPQLGAVP